MARRYLENRRESKVFEIAVQRDSLRDFPVANDAVAAPVAIGRSEPFRVRRGDMGTDEGVEKQALLNAIRKTVGVLQKTKDLFKSKELQSFLGKFP